MDSKTLGIFLKHLHKLKIMNIVSFGYDLNLSSIQFNFQFQQLANIWLFVRLHFVNTSCLPFGRTLWYAVNNQLLSIHLNTDIILIFLVFANNYTNILSSAIECNEWTIVEQCKVPLFCTFFFTIDNWNGFSASEPF